MINTAICNILNNNFDFEVQECFDEMFSGLCNPILSGIFLSLLKEKEYSTDEIISGINSARNAIKKQALCGDYDFLIENICLNADNNYLDISFAMDIICASNNIGAVKSIPSYYSYKNNSYETLKTFDINIENLNPDNFEKLQFLYGYIPSDNPYLKYTQELYRILPYETILNIINLFLNYYSVKNCTIALSDASKVENYASICLQLGYANSIVFSGGNFPYVSPEGETTISEAWKNKIFSYKVTPELLGIKQNSIENLKIENISHNKEIIKAVFENKLKDSSYDVIVINSGLALYITKKAKSLMEGIELAKKTIDNGCANEMLLTLKNKTPLL